MLKMKLYKINIDGEENVLSYLTEYIIEKLEIKNYGTI